LRWTNYIIDYCKKRDVEISSLAYYPNTLDPDLSKRKQIVEHLKKVIRASHMLNVNMVTTFIGRDQYKTVEENLEIVKEVWPDILRYAEALKVRIGIENCPMIFGKDQWPGGQNLMTTPVLFRKIFELLDSKYLGLNFDPSHFIWQQLDYINPLYEFKDKLFHIHFKDIKLYRNSLSECGIMAYPLDYMAPKLPGLGDVNWSEFVSSLNDIHYDSFACIEVEDRSYESSKEKILESIDLSKKYLELFIS